MKKFNTKKLKHNEIELENILLNSNKIANEDKEILLKLLEKEEQSRKNLEDFYKTKMS